MTAAITISALNKIYEGGHHALKNIDLQIQSGEIFALLGPNGAGKTTLIGTVCGLVNPTSGSVTVCGHDIIKDYRAARGCIGLVPQELATDPFEKVRNVVAFTRGLFGKAPNPALIEDILRRLSLWEKRDMQVRTLSGGMKRRLLIAKALSHEPNILFLDEPSAGVDVELRKSMWEEVRNLRETGVTVILTTHYLEEAEEMADRIGVIRKGELILVEQTADLMKKLGKKELSVDLQTPIATLPGSLANFNLSLAGDGARLTYSYDSQQENNGIHALLHALKDAHIGFKDLSTRQSSLEDIFVGLIEEKRP